MIAEREPELTRATSVVMSALGELVIVAVVIVLLALVWLSAEPCNGGPLGHKHAHQVHSGGFYCRHRGSEWLYYDSGAPPVFIRYVTPDEIQTNPIGN